MVSDDGVFWWKKKNEVILTIVWDDLVLLLHTMEETQVGGVRGVVSCRMGVVSCRSIL